MFYLKRQFFNRSSLLLIVLTCSSFQLNAQDAAISIRLLHDDNVGFAPVSEQATSKGVIRVSGEKTFSKRLGPYSDLNLTGMIDINEYRDYAEDHVDVALLAAYTRKLGLGFKAPRLTVGLLGESRNYEIDLRDIFVTRIAVGISKPVHERVDLAFNVSAETHNARVDQVGSTPTRSQLDRNAFDRDFLVAELSATSYLNSNWTLPISVSLIDGDLVSISRPDPAVLARAAAANDYSEVLPGTIAYLSEGRANSISIGLNRSLTDHSALSFLYTAQSGKTGTDTKYSRDLLSLEYTVRW